MELIYVDESGTEGVDEWFLLGCFIMPSGKWRILNDRIQDALPLEVRGDSDALKQISDPRGPLDEETRRTASRKVYELLDKKIDYQSICIFIDQTEQDHWGPDAVLRNAFRLLLERLEMSLQQRYETGVIFVDQRDDHSPKKIREWHYEIGETGTYYVDITRIAGVAAPLDADYSLPMTLGDWMVRSMRQHFLKGNSRYYRHVEPHVARHARTNEILGSGIKVVPDGSVQKFEYHPDRDKVSE